MFKNYFKIAWRNLTRNKSYAIINVTGLAVGIAACLLISLWVQREFSYDDFNKKADRIYLVYTDATSMGANKDIAVTPNIVGPLLTRKFPEIEEAVRLNRSAGVIRYHQHFFREDDFFFADSTFFNIFTFHFLKGDPNTALSGPNSVVITRSAARRYFGSENPIGKTITFQNRYKLEVTGVIKNVPSTSTFRFEFIASWISQKGWQSHYLTWNSANFHTYLLLNKNADAAQLRQKIDRLLHKLKIGGQSVRPLALMPLTRLHLYANLAYALDPTGDIRYVYIFSAIAILILLIACINYMNLATVRSAERAQEIGVRKVLGASRAQLTRQFYGETILLVGISLFLGVCLVQMSLPLFNDITDTSFKLKNLPIGELLLVMCSIGSFITIVAGSYPAVSAYVFNPVQILKGSFQMRQSNTRLRKGLVVLQFVIAVFLVICTFIIRGQLNYLQNKNMGFDTEHVMIIPANDPALKKIFQQQAGVQSVSFVNQYPSSLGWTGDAVSRGSSDTVSIKGFITDNNIVKTLGLKLIAGRDFLRIAPNPDSGKSCYRYLLNETAARAFGWSPKEAIGKPFNVLGDRNGTVIGVVKDFNYASLRKNIEPMAIWYNSDRTHYMLVRVAPGNTKHTLASLKNQWSKVKPDIPFTYLFLDDAFNLLYRNEQQDSHVVGVFACLAIFTASLGLFGLTAYAAEQRTKEIGIRKVLGATVANIVGLLSKDFLKLVLLGFVIAIPIAWYTMNRWLQTFAYRIEIGPGIFFAAGALAVIIALATVSWQSIRAALANPTDSLRSE